MDGNTTHNKRVLGTLIIKEDDWSWIPQNLEKYNAEKLARDIEFIRRVNPASGLTFSRHMKHASSCHDYIDDTKKYAKCVSQMYKLNTEKRG